MTSTAITNMDMIQLKVNWVVVIIFLVVSWQPVISTLMESVITYTDTNCQGTPLRVNLRENENCTSERSLCESDGVEVGTQYVSTSCLDVDQHEYVSGIFSEFPYVTFELYNDGECKSLFQSASYLATGTCQRATYGNKTSSDIVRLYPNGSAVLELFNDSSCGINADATITPTGSKIASHICYGDDTIGYKFYSSVSPTDNFNVSSSSGSSATVDPPSSSTETLKSSTHHSIAGIIGIIIGSVMLAVFLVTVLVWKRQSKSKQWIESEEVESPVDHQCDDSKFNPSYMSDTTERGTMTEVHVPRRSSIPYRENSGIGGVWDDEAIVAVRIPYNKVLVHELISRDGYAEVFKGTFNGHLVTVKSLLPQSRQNVEHVTNFCSEVKMMATMDHPRIAQLIGVSWDSKANVCVVSEYLDGGDLRSLLDSFAQLNHPVGFDYDKVKIALHMAHALTYLHSLEPSVIHRNLKSKNVLLSYELDAKLTDFGISREQMDITMTAGVGSTLWMAPEVVMGHRYDEKADIFSFGVVLSELDVHSLPYAYADNSNSRHKMPESLILQQMVAGKLQVEFSQRDSGAAQELGKACVAVVPSQRPTAAEVLYRLHTLLSREL